MNFMEALYAQQAVKAFDAKEYRKCLALLANLKQWNHETVKLLVNSSYNHWNDARENREAVNYDGALSFAHKSFSRLMNGSIPFELISPQDYIKLTHIYLCEGNLRSALMITNLASARGYLEDIFVVTQSFLILKRIGKSSDIVRYFEFIVSKLTDISSTLRNNITLLTFDDRIVLCALLLYCTNQLRIQIKDANRKQSEQKIRLLQTFCGAAYLLRNGSKCYDLDAQLIWLKDTEVWLSIGNALKNGPYILLAEELFWIGFCQSILDESFISLAYDCLINTKRLDKVPSFLVNAYAISHWNLFVRHKLREWAINNENQDGEKWISRLESEEEAVIEIQRVFRGYCLRKNWLTTSIRLRQIRDEFSAKIGVSDIMFAKYRSRLLIMRFNDWKTHVSQLKQEKWSSAIKLQSFSRTYQSQFILYKIKLDVAAANGKFLSCLMMHCTRLRFRCFRKWYDGYFEIRKINAAHLIRDVLIANGYNQLLVKGMGILLALLRIHKVHEMKRRFKTWLKRYQEALKRHAIATIRFFARRSLLRAAERAIEEQLFKLESDVMVRRSTDFRANYLPLLREMLLRWNMEFKKIANFKKRCKMVLCLQNRFRKYKACQKLKELFLRNECQNSFFWLFRMKKLSGVFYFWRQLRSLRVIQRAFRCFRSKKQYLRRLFKHQRFEKYCHEKMDYQKRNVLRRWAQFVFIVQKDLIRNRRKSNRAFLWWRHQSRICSILKRRCYAALLLYKLHFIHIRYSFLRLSHAARLCKTTHSLEAMVANWTRKLIKNAFRQLRIQGLIQKLLRLQMTSGPSQAFPVTLYDCSFRYKWKHFHVWRSLFRKAYDSRVRLVTSMSNSLLKDVCATMSRRRNNVVVIQSVIRGYRDRLFATALLKRFRATLELKHLGAQILLKICWNKWWKAYQKHTAAMIVIRRFGKSALRKSREQQQRQHLRNLAIKSKLLQSSLLYHRSVLKKAFRGLLYAFLKVELHGVSGRYNSLSHVCEPIGKKPLIRTKISRPSLMKNLEFQSESFHAAILSTVRTKCFIYDTSTNMSQSELSYCIHHASSIFISLLDIPIVEAVSKYFCGCKIVIHDCISNEFLINFILSLLLQRSCSVRDDSWPSSLIKETKHRNAIQLHFINVASKPLLFCRLFSDISNIYRSSMPCNRYIEDLEFNTSSVGYLGTMKFLWMAKVRLIFSFVGCNSDIFAI